ADAEVAERVMIERDPAGDPAEGVVTLAQPRQLPGAADAVERGVQPQRNQDAGIGGVAAAVPFHGLNPSQQRPEIEGADILPDKPRLMLRGDEGVDALGGDHERLPLDSRQTRNFIRVGGVPRSDVPYMRNKRSGIEESIGSVGHQRTSLPVEASLY